MSNDLAASELASNALVSQL